MLYFYGVDNLTLRGVKVGHNEGPGVCSGGVVQLEYCRNALLEGCKLFGCGTVGVEAFYANDLTVHQCEIYQCSMGGVQLRGCERAQIVDCDLHDIGESDDDFFYFDENCRDIQVNGEHMR